MPGLLASIGAWNKVGDVPSAKVVAFTDYDPAANISPCECGHPIGKHGWIARTPNAKNVWDKCFGHIVCPGDDITNDGAHAPKPIKGS